MSPGPPENEGVTGQGVSPQTTVWRPEEGVPQSGNGASTRGAPHRRRRRRSRPPGTSYALYTAGVLALLLAFDTAYVALRIQGPLRGAQTALEDGIEAFRDADLRTAEDQFLMAAAEGRHAADLAGRPGPLVTSLIPFLGDNVRAARALARVAEQSALAGTAAVAMGRELGLTATGLAPTIYSDGRVQLEAMRTAFPHLEDVDGRLVAAELFLGVERTPFLAVLKEALADARDEVAEARASVGIGRALFDVLPPLLGGKRERRYLLTFQALGEARGTGGLIGVYGLLRTHEGKVSLGHVGPIRELIPLPGGSVPAPPWFEESYGPYALRQWQQANLSPSFPAVAEVLLNMYQSVTGEELDGVVAMDAVALQYLLAGMKPLEVPGVDTPLGPGNTADFLMRDSYLEFTPAEQEQIIAAAVREFWGRVRDGQVDIEALAGGLGRATASQHFKIFADDPNSQEPLRRLGVDGDFSRAGPNVQLVFSNSYSLNKADYFLRRRLDTEIRLTPEGDARVTTTATLQNTAPPGPPSTLLGLEHAPGLNQMTLHFLLPRGAMIGSLAVDGNPTGIPPYDENGFPVVWQPVDIAAGDTKIARVTYSVSRAATMSAEGGSFAFTFFPQATAFPDTFSLTVMAPDGFELLSGDSDDPPSTKFTLSGDLSRPATTTLQLRRR